jgi:hypothetical protein
VDAFLSRGRNGPEHRALVEALARLDSLNRAESDQIQEEELPGEAAEKLSRALGGSCSMLEQSAQDIQQNLFEAAVTSEGETIRQRLAVYLHGKHERTVDAAQARAMPVPDSLGG